MSLRQMRESRVLTQEELARASGVSLSQIIRLESGKSRARPATVRKLATALKIAATKIQAAIAEMEESQ